jgi:RND family efflux transporter MFP subunit
LGGVFAPGSAAVSTPADPPAAPTILVEVIRAEPSTHYSLEQVFVGRVEALRRAELGFERGGLLTEVTVREGDQVEASTTLARLDPSLLRAARHERSAELASAEAERALAEATAKRYEDSVKDGAVTRQALDEAREGARAAEARLRLAQARIASLDLDLTKTELRAPFDGTVIRRIADEGTVLGAGQPVLVLQERTVPEVRVGIGGPLVEQLAQGQRYPLRINGHTIESVLRAVLPLRAGSSLTVDALFDPLPDQTAGKAAAIDDGQAPDNGRTKVHSDEHQQLLRPGNLVELRLTKAIDSPGFWLPLTALTEGRRGLWRTLVAEPLDAATGAAGSAASDPSSRWRLSSRPLQVLYVDGERAYVQGPLNAGDLVVAAGIHRVVTGQVVRIRERAAEGADPAADQVPPQAAIATRTSADSEGR